MSLSKVVTMKNNANSFETFVFWTVSLCTFNASRKKMEKAAEVFISLRVRTLRYVILSLEKFDSNIILKNF